MIAQFLYTMPRLRRSTLLFILPVWGAMGSILVVTLGVLLIQSGAPDFIAQIVDPSHESYNLFTSIPQQGSVLGQHIESNDLRVVKVQAFLDSYRSPMPAQAFIDAADQYNLPWTLLPAIACKESGCGRAIPRDSFNAFGWAVYTGQNSGANFDSWEHAISTVARGLRKNYFDKGLDTVIKIESRYTPPSARSDHSWQKDIDFFMDKIENWQL
ncbi:hypothetical protein COX05_03670 [candidate division WWE3 bacterium CG22_combo_CG10-13_8_21_14_all_39_12]|uniref:Uncharacterized protein n=2 Tax=Katanobacteria TaxID=422282 RepID=A0A2M7X5J9_UNCKA|nr:MAG: hypothetical protein COX05_03670 [candidate division WWE3 bacterium CG22_combo_CG10-13_8_21_14_all_39_12]PJA41389.1 MAG: hypothetical protein CO179_00080 [candidate division WWE3 bacterium CG_4_9_14_3_um_filter_39_7]